MKDLSRPARNLFELLIREVESGRFFAESPETFLGYGEVLEKLDLPQDAPAGVTSGETLQLNGLNELGPWIANPHFLALRSVPMALSGASRRKQIPSSRWLRSLGKEPCSVRLSWLKRDQLTLTHRDANGHSSTMQVPVEIHGKPPVIAFHPVYLAQALEIGSTLCLSDELSPGICRHPAGRFCVLMPMRVVNSESTQPEKAKAA